MSDTPFPRPGGLTYADAGVDIDAGEMLVDDSSVSGWINSQAHFLHLAIPVLCTVGVVIVGKWMDARNHRPQAAAAA